MDMLFFLTGCLALAETVDLFCGKDFLIFLTDSIRPEDYDIKKVFSVEKWLFAADTLALFGIAWHLGGFYGDLLLLGVLFVTMIAHIWVFKSAGFRSGQGKGNEKGGRDGSRRRGN